MSGSFAENDLQLKASSESSPPRTFKIHKLFCRVLQCVAVQWGTCCNEWMNAHSDTLHHSLCLLKHTLQHTATHCNALQHTAPQSLSLESIWYLVYSQVSFQRNVAKETCCNELMHTAIPCTTAFVSWKYLVCGHPSYCTTHCNTLQHTATHCDTLQHTATHGKTRQHTSTHCNTRQHTATDACILRDSTSENSAHILLLWAAMRCMVHFLSVLQCVAVCCSVLQCVAVCCSVLQGIAVCQGSVTRRMWMNHVIYKWVVWHMQCVAVCVAVSCSVTYKWVIWHMLQCIEEELHVTYVASSICHVI